MYNEVVEFTEPKPPELRYIYRRRQKKTEEEDTATTWASGNPGHSWQNVAMGKSSVAHKGVLYAAKVLAATAADLMTKPELLEKAKAEFAVSAAAGYDCPLGMEVKAPHVDE